MPSLTVPEVSVFALRMRASFLSALTGDFLLLMDSPIRAVLFGLTRLGVLIEFRLPALILDLATSILRVFLSTVLTGDFFRPIELTMREVLPELIRFPKLVLTDDFFRPIELTMREVLPELIRFPELTLTRFLVSKFIRFLLLEKLRDGAERTVFPELCAGGRLEVTRLGAALLLRLALGIETLAGLLRLALGLKALAG